MGTERARDLLRGASVQMLLGMAVLTGATAGLGLAAYTTGNLRDQLANEIRPIAELVGNPYAAQVDLPAGASDAGGIPPGEIRCRGCGPSIRERLWDKPFDAVYDEPAVDPNSYYDGSNDDDLTLSEHQPKAVSPPESAVENPPLEAGQPGTVAIIHRDGLVRLEDIQAYPSP